MNKLQVNKVKEMFQLKDRKKQNSLIRERREDEINNVNERQNNNQPLPQPKDIEEIEY